MPPADLKAAREAALAARNNEPMRGPGAAAGGVKAAVSKTMKTAPKGAQPASDPEKVGASAGKSTTKPSNKE
jgi:hypothetical protein